MSSDALATWTSTAQDNLDQLERIHRAATGERRGRRWGTTQLNRSLLVALVGQFQGYCRDLHDEAVKVHVNHAKPGQGPVLQILLTQNRKLNSGNPRKGALGADFGRLGFTFIDAVKATDADAGNQLDSLEELIDYRNAVVHNNESEISSLEAAGDIKATLGVYRKRRKTLGRLAATVDLTVSKELKALLSIAPPW